MVWPGSNPSWLSQQRLLINGLQVVCQKLKVSSYILINGEERITIKLIMENN